MLSLRYTLRFLKRNNEELDFDTQVMNLNSPMNIGHINCAVYTDLFQPVESCIQ